MLGTFQTPERTARPSSRHRQPTRSTQGDAWQGVRAPLQGLRQISLRPERPERCRPPPRRPRRAVPAARVARGTGSSQRRAGPSAGGMQHPGRMGVSSRALRRAAPWLRRSRQRDSSPSSFPAVLGGLQPGGAFVLKQGATELRQPLWWAGWEPLPFLPPAGELDPCAVEHAGSQGRRHRAGISQGLGMVPLVWGHRSSCARYEPLLSWVFSPLPRQKGPRVWSPGDAARSSSGSPVASRCSASAWPGRGPVLITCSQQEPDSAGLPPSRPQREVFLQR